MEDPFPIQRQGGLSHHCYQCALHLCPKHFSKVGHALPHGPAACEPVVHCGHRIKRRSLLRIRPLAAPHTAGLLPLDGRDLHGLSNLALLLALRLGLDVRALCGGRRARRARLSTASPGAAVRLPPRLRLFLLARLAALELLFQIRLEPEAPPKRLSNF
jgi:hypothetical protein